MKVDVNISFNYGGWVLHFRKTIEMDTPPFYGMYLLEEKNGKEGMWVIENTKSTFSAICYDIYTRRWRIDIRHSLSQPSGEEIDNILQEMEGLEWERIDTEDIERLKQLLQKNGKF